MMQRWPAWSATRRFLCISRWEAKSTPGRRLISPCDLPTGVARAVCPKARAITSITQSTAWRRRGSTTQTEFSAAGIGACLAALPHQLRRNQMNKLLITAAALLALATPALADNTIPADFHGE